MKLAVSKSHRYGATKRIQDQSIVQMIGHRIGHIDDSKVAAERADAKMVASILHAMLEFVVRHC